MTIIKLFPSGAWEVSDIINGRLFRLVFYGYTRRAALSEFKRRTKHEGAAHANL